MSAIELYLRKFYYCMRKNLALHTFYDTLSDVVSFVARRRPLRQRDTELQAPPFFIIGSGRSGNTLMRAVLTAHPDVAIPPESYVLGKVARLYRAYSYLPWHVLVKIVLAEFEYHPQFVHWDTSLRTVYADSLALPKDQRDLAQVLDLVYRHYACSKMPGTSRWGEKTPLNTLHLNWIDRVFPDALYVHMLRDGRDVVSSYIRAGLYDNLEQAAERWTRSVTVARSFGRKNPDRVLEVRYEDLVSHPSVEVRRVCRFLDLSFRADMLTYHDSVDRMGDTGLPHHRGLTRPINADSIGKWTTDLSDRDARFIEEQLAETLRRTGYT